MNECCSRIDDFLDGDLTAEESAAWLTLARHCDRCRETLELQRHLDDHLCSAWAMVEPPSCRHLARPTQTQHWLSLSLTLRVAGALGVAGSLLAAAVFLSRGITSVSDGSHQTAVVAVPLQQPVMDDDAGLREESETIIASSSGLVIPVVSKPEYTIVRYVPVVVRSDGYAVDHASNMNIGDLP